MIEQKSIWTIGHSTHSLDTFISLLKDHSIATVVDVRTYPGSRKFPHFNKEELQASLEENDIQYFHSPELGGRRKPVPESRNTLWQNDAFRGYADYMETSGFKKGIENLVSIAQKSPTAYMCAEAVWWRCHRSLVSDYLKVNGWQVLHILSPGKTTEHPYTKPARVENGELKYDEPNLFSD